MRKRKTLGEMCPAEIVKGIIALEEIAYRYNPKHSARTEADFPVEKFSKERLIKEYSEIREYCEDRFL